ARHLDDERSAYARERISRRGRDGGTSQQLQQLFSGLALKEIAAQVEGGIREKRMPGKSPFLHEPRQGLGRKTCLVSVKVLAALFNLHVVSVDHVAYQDRSRT